MSVDLIFASEREKLSRHLERSPTLVLFFIENTPNSPREAKCKLPSCNGTIRAGTHRLALNPGMRNSKSSDVYHVACFEEIADFSQTDFLRRVEPLTRRCFQFRGLQPVQILDGDYFCQGAVERLVMKWKVDCGRQVRERDGIVHPTQPENSDGEPPAGFMNLMNNAGSSTASFDRIPGMSDGEFFNLSHTLAPFESDGPGDTNEWNLFTAYLNASVDDRSSLSGTLNRWERDSNIVMTDDAYLDEAARQRKAQLGEKACRAIKRLSEILMPDFQAMYRGLAW